MFAEPILKRLETKFQSVVNHASGTALALLPLVVAIGFGTAAADSWLKEAYGEQASYLILGATYLVIAIVVYVIARARERRSAATAAAQLAEMPIGNPVREAVEQLNLPSIEETLLSFVGKTSAPAAKAVAEKAAKNFHLLVGAGMGIYLASWLVDALNRRHGYEK